MEATRSAAAASASAAWAGIVDPVPGCYGLAIDVDGLWRRRLSDDDR
jgi:hypothetical protein